MKKSPDEKPRKQIADEVVTAKKSYFSPELGESVEADDQTEATKKIKQKLTDRRKKQASDNEVRDGE